MISFHNKTLKVVLFSVGLASMLQADVESIVIDKSNVHIRNAPDSSTRSNIVSKAKFGEAYKVIQTEGNWYTLENNFFVHKSCAVPIDRNIVTELKVVKNSFISSKPKYQKKYSILVKKNKVFNSYAKVGKWYLLDNGKYIPASAVKVFNKLSEKKISEPIVTEIVIDKIEDLEKYKLAKTMDVIQKATVKLIENNKSLENEVNSLRVIVDDLRKESRRQYVEHLDREMNSVSKELEKDTKKIQQFIKN